MADNLIQPTVMATPFAMNGDRNNLPPEHMEGSARATLDVGFPPETSKPVAEGGVPPTRADFNGLGYLLTSFSYFMQNGGTFGFDTNVATAIGGYPENARLWGTDANGKGFIVRSVKKGNFDNFQNEPAYIGSVKGQVNNVGGKAYTVSWVYDMVTQSYVDSTFANTSLSNIQKPNLVWGVQNTMADVVVESTIGYGNSDKWYRLYKSGWIEQGGILFPLVDNGEQYVSIPKAMRLICGAQVISNSARHGTDSDAGNIGIETVWGTDNIVRQVIVRLGRKHSRNPESNKAFWEVKGMIA